MQRTDVATVATPFCALLLLGALHANCSPQSPSQLARKTALRILTDTPKALPPAAKLQVARLPHWIPYLEPSIEEMSGSGPLILPALSEFPLEERFRADLLTGHFLLILKERQLLKLETLTTDTRRVGVLGLAGPVAKGSVFKFSLGDPKELEISLEHDDAWHKKLVAVAARPRFAEVTGILQEGSYAFAEVRIEWAPTATLAYLQAVAVPLVKKQLRLESDAFISWCPRNQPGYLCDLLRYKTPAPQEVKYMFARFDDGWRLHR